MQVRLDVPRSVAAGTTLHFRVVIDWPEGGGLGYGTPPLYVMRLGDRPPAGDPYVLRWDPVPGGVAGSVAFDMNLDVPAETPTGPTTLTWQVVEPALPPMTANVTVVAPSG